ncbi:MAG: hypothetical protein GY719_30570 [bacterium]|nr:hypothetical protein [bacterium]
MVRVVHRTTSLIILSLWVAAAAVAEWQPGPDDEILVSPEDSVTVIEWCDLMANDGLSGGCPAPGVSSVVVSSTIHGTLSSGEEKLVYSPRRSFWRLGTDSFTYRLDLMSGEPKFVNVTLKAGHYGQVRRIEESFESGSADGLSGDAWVLPEAAIAGSMGLKVRVADGTTASVFTFNNDGEDSGELCEEDGSPPQLVPIVNCFYGGGDGAQGGNDTMRVRPPPIENPDPWGGGSSNAAQASSIGPVVIYALEAFESDVAAEIELVPGAQGWEVVAHLYGGGSTYSTQPFPLASPEPKLRLDWWNGGVFVDGRIRDGGLMLWVDGEVVDAILGIEGWYVGDARRYIGAMIDPQSRFKVSLDIDDIRLQASNKSTPGAATILYDGFEDDLSDWDTSAALAIDVDPAAALVGKQGLRVEPTTGVASSLFDRSPTVAEQVGIRFKIAPGTLSMEQGDQMKIMALSTFDQIKAGKEQVRLLLRNEGEYFEILPRVRNDKRWVVLPGVAVPFWATTVELRWRAADDGAENGRLGVWIEGELSHDVRGLDNQGILIESVRLGAWKVGGYTEGAFYVDNFESWSTVNAQ